MVPVETLIRPLSFSLAKTIGQPKDACGFVTDIMDYCGNMWESCQAMPVITCGEVDLWVEQRGTGPDVILIAGLGDTHGVWDAQLAGLAHSYRLTAFDNRGVGHSSLPDEELTIAGMAEDCRRLIGRLSLAPVHVVGSSMGGAIAQELAIRAPETVRSLTLVGTWAHADNYLKAQFESWRWMVQHGPRDQGLLAALDLWVHSRDAYDSGAAARWVSEALDDPSPQSVEAYSRTVSAAMAHDTIDRLHRIKAPTLIVAGTSDLICPPRFSREIADRIPHSRLELLEGAAHQPFQEAPERFNALVDEFWRRPSP
jgi:pimeloyl-ACP methyl ester carboxylesterase